MLWTKVALALKGLKSVSIGKNMININIYYLASKPTPLS